MYRLAPLKSTVSRNLVASKYSLANRAFSSTAIRLSALSDAIKKDHREIEEYYNNIINAKDDDEATRWQNQFVWELARHSIAEELVVYPAFEKNLGETGHLMAEKDRAEHQTVSLPGNPNGNFLCNHPTKKSADTSVQVKEALKTFQQLRVDAPNFTSTLNSLMDSLKQHIHEEEHDDLPALDATLSSEDAESMTKSFGRTKAFVPSRSHPMAPSKPPFETVVGLMAAPIDHLADMLRKFPDKTVSPNPSTKWAER